VLIGVTITSGEWWVIDKINRVFAILARQHYVLYIVVGLIPSYFFVFDVEHKTKVNILKMWGGQIVFFSVLIVVLYSCFKHLFYGMRPGQYVWLGKYGVVVKDLYFLTRISNNIGPFKKASGYLYVIFRIAHSMVHGFAGGVALFMWLLP